MDSIKKILFVVFLCNFLFLSHVNASTCDYETQVNLQREAANVKAVYEADYFGTGEFEVSEVSHEEYEVTVPKVKVNIYNLTENLYVTVRNKLSNTETTYRYSDSDNGTIEWMREDLDNIVEYEIKIFSNHPSCTGEEINKITLKTPKYNNYVSEYFCQSQNDYYCQEFILDEITISREQMEQTYVERMKQQSSSIIDEKEKGFFEKYFIYILIGILLVIGGYAAVIVIRKQRNKVI